MTIKKSSLIKVFFFLLAICSLATYLVSQYGLFRGIHSTLLMWSFYVLCIPLSGSSIIMSTLFSLFTQKKAYFPGMLAWLTAIAVNIFSYFFLPQAYSRMVTTFLLYRIISTPWPLWLIIGASGLGGVYNTLIMRSPTKKFQFKHLLAKTILMSIGIATLLYLAYIEVILFLSAKSY